MSSDPLAIYRGSRVAVVGAAGFIGRWVARALSQRGAELTLFVRDLDAAAAIFRQWGVRGDVRAVDLEAEGAVAGAIAELRPAVVCNLAGYGVDRSERDERLAWRLNAGVPHELALAVAASSDERWPGQQLVHAGSALEYGTLRGSLDELRSGTPTTTYAQSKLAGTLGMLVAARNHGARAACARLFTVYGPGEHEGRLLPSLLATARDPKPLPLTEGLQRRDFTYVEEVAEGLLRIGASEVPPPHIVNLATGRLASVREFALTAARVLALTEALLRFGELPARPEEMRHGAVTTLRLQACTGWKPELSIEEGIRRTREFLDAALP